MGEYAVAHLDEIEEQNDGRCRGGRPGTFRRHVLRRGDVDRPRRGDRIINEHDEDEDEELYLVMAGSAVFELDGERIDAPTGTFVFAPPGVKRTAFAQEAGTTVLALGGTPGVAYEPSGWELWAPFNEAYRQDRSPRR